VEAFGFEVSSVRNLHCFWDVSPILFEQEIAEVVIG